jgi:hypothetical protein
MQGVEHGQGNLLDKEHNRSRIEAVIGTLAALGASSGFPLS